MIRLGHPLGVTHSFGGLGRRGRAILIGLPASAKAGEYFVFIPLFASHQLMWLLTLYALPSGKFYLSHEDMMKRVNTKKSSSMRIAFRKARAVYTLIDEYAAWKFSIHPYQAGAYRALLIRFVQSRGIEQVEDISEKDIAYFIGGELTGHYSAKAVKALRSFLWYAERAGYKCTRYNAVSEIKVRADRERSIMFEKLAEARKPSWKAGAIPKWKKA